MRSCPTWPSLIVRHSSVSSPNSWETRRPPRSLDRSAVSIRSAQEFFRPGIMKREILPSNRCFPQVSSNWLRRSHVSYTWRRDSTCWSKMVELCYDSLIQTFLFFAEWLELVSSVARGGTGFDLLSPSSCPEHTEAFAQEHDRGIWEVPLPAPPRWSRFGVTLSHRCSFPSTVVGGAWLDISQAFARCCTLGQLGWQPQDGVRSSSGHHQVDCEKSWGSPSSPQRQCSIPRPPWHAMVSALQHLGASRQHGATPREGKAEKGNGTSWRAIPVDHFPVGSTVFSLFLPLFASSCRCGRPLDVLGQLPWVLGLTAGSWRTSQHAFAERPEDASEWTSSPGAWIFAILTGWTGAGWKWWWTAIWNGAQLAVKSRHLGLLPSETTAQHGQPQPLQMGRFWTSPKDRCSEPWAVKRERQGPFGCHGHGTDLPVRSGWSWADLNLALWVWAGPGWDASPTSCPRNPNRAVGSGSSAQKTGDHRTTKPTVDGSIIRVREPPECSNCLCNCLQPLHFGTQICRGRSSLLLLLWGAQTSELFQFSRLPLHCDLRPVALRRFWQSASLPVRWKPSSLSDLDCDRPMPPSGHALGPVANSRPRRPRSRGPSLLQPGSKLLGCSNPYVWIHPDRKTGWLLHTLQSSCDLDFRGTIFRSQRCQRCLEIVHLGGWRISSVRPLPTSMHWNGRGMLFGHVGGWVHCSPFGEGMGRGGRGERGGTGGEGERLCVWGGRRGERGRKSKVGGEPSPSTPLPKPPPPSWPRPLGLMRRPCFLYWPSAMSTWCVELVHIGLPNTMKIIITNKINIQSFKQQKAW